MDEFEQRVWGARAMLRRYAISLYRDPTKADDAVSDTICRALENRAQFKEGTILNAWLATILKNAFKSEMKKASRLIFTDEPQYADHLPAAGDPERMLIAREGLEAVDALPPLYRGQVVATATGYKYTEIAEMFGIPLGTVRSRISRTRKVLMEAA